VDELKLLSRDQAYIDRYNYKHTPITGAVDEMSNVSFSFHIDQVSLSDLHRNFTDERCRQACCFYGLLMRVFSSS
jgi:hypothetical protein